MAQLWMEAGRDHRVPLLSPKQGRIRRPHRAAQLLDSGLNTRERPDGTPPKIPRTKSRPPGYWNHKLLAWSAAGNIITRIFAINFAGANLVTLASKTISVLNRRRGQSGRSQRSISNGHMYRKTSSEPHA